MLRRITVPIVFAVAIPFIVVSTWGCDGIFQDVDDLEFPGEPDLDAGLDATPDDDAEAPEDVEDEPDDTGEDADVDECEPESDEELCENLGAECDSAVGVDRCGNQRAVACSAFDGFECEGLRKCVDVELDDETEIGQCQCPQLGEDPASEICDEVNADCGTLEASDVCEGWDEIGEVNCGGCDEPAECGEEIDNVCGCPCEVDGECFAAGTVKSDDEPCQVCLPEEADDEFTDLTELEGRLACGDECIDPDTNPDHCGGCDNECLVGEDEATPVCTDGTCGADCGDDLTICGPICSTDGECGDDDDASCIIDGDEGVCAEQCVDTDADHDHCGECNQGCDSDDVCADGDCLEECPGDQTACDGACFETDTDIRHCGECDNECPDDVQAASPTCEAGECGYVCDEDDDTFCEDEGLCTDTDTDDDHCGKCGNDCGDNEICEDGECVCADGYEPCGEDEVCVDTDSDHEHCGECLDPCADVHVCVDGECEECPDDQTACDGTCYDTDTNPDHCGDCFEECPDDVDGASPVCNDGQCGYECDDDNDTLCEDEGLCTDTDTDDDHCDECDNPCTGDDSCFGGECKECEKDEHCPDGDRCNPVNNNCVDCLDNDDCDGVCDGSTWQCVECTDSDHCGDDVCHLSSNECVECTDDYHCADEDACSDNHTCVCDAECCSDSDCDQYEECESNSCVCNEDYDDWPNCCTDDHCSGNYPYCLDTECEECAENDHCNQDDCETCSDGVCEGCPDGFFCAADGNCHPEQ